MPEALLQVHNGCYTLAVNEAHWRVFGSQLPAQEASPLIERLLEAQTPVPGALWHCRQIRAIEALRRSHCGVETAHDQLRRVTTATNLEFVRMRSSEHERNYAIWIITASLVRPASPHLVLVRLTPVPGVTVTVRTLGGRTTQTRVLRAGTLWLPASEFAVSENDAQEYILFDEELAHAEVDCGGGQAEGALEFLRNAASAYRLPERYPQRLILEGLGQGVPRADVLKNRIRHLRARLCDAFPVVDSLRPRLIGLLREESDLMGGDPPADSQGVDSASEYWAFDEAGDQAALQERARQERTAAQYRLVLLEQPTRSLITQLAIHGPQTRDQLGAGTPDVERALDALLAEDLISGSQGRFQLTTGATAILNTAWADTIRNEISRRSRP